MKKIEFDILLKFFEENFISVEELTIELFKSKTEIQEALSFLEKENYIFNNEITEKGRKKLREYPIDNAIILAAGMSSRFVPLSYETPKGLLMVKGEPLIESQIKAIREKGVQEIVIVVGHMKEHFEYLIEKYGVILVESKEYKKRNNHSSIYAARKYLKNSIITSSDLYFTKNIFQTYAYDSYYCTIYMSGKTAERGIETDNDDKILDTFYGDKCYDVWVTLGYAFFSKRFSQKMIEFLEKEYDKPETTSKFWADIQDAHLNDLYMYVKRCADETIYEFDSLEELREFDNLYLDNSGSKIMQKISSYLGVRERNIIKLESLRRLKESMFKFECKGEVYVCDIEADEREKISHLGKMYYQCRDFKEKNMKLFKMNKKYILEERRIWI
nr:NTP transferase domain-containing protein [Fusobacterium necrophorum]